LALIRAILPSRPAAANNDFDGDFPHE
jgi:hypothetical protein